MILVEVIEMLPLVVILIAIVAAAVFGPRFGVDSRPNTDECGCWI